MHLEGGYLYFPLFFRMLVYMSPFFKRALRKETSLNSEGNNSILALYFNVYDIHVNTLFKAVKNGFTVKVKKYLRCHYVAIKIN